MSNAYRSALKTPGTMPTGDAVVGDVLSGKTFSNANAVGLTGTMVNRGAVSQTIQPGGSYTIPAGYHNGSGVVSASSYTPTFTFVNQERFPASTSSRSFTYTAINIGDYLFVDFIATHANVNINIGSGATVLASSTDSGDRQHSIIAKVTSSQVVFNVTGAASGNSEGPLCVNEITL